MSQRIDQIAEVIKIITAEIDNLFEQGRTEVYEEESYAIMQQAFASVAQKYNLKESTIRDKCTRQIDLTSEMFCKKLVEHVTGNRSLNIHLKNYKCDKDTDAYVDFMVPVR